MPSVSDVICDGPASKQKQEGETRCNGHHGLIEVINDWDECKFLIK